ncbi:MAG TPA: hypothetical protein VGS60_05585 [Actinomycetes bacterium]|jgi:hypothetical protein|nr:hypothetical protein [Actinomycetes bacterium]
MHRTRLITLSVATAAALIAWSASAATADPTNAKDTIPIQLACDNGHTYTVVANGNGQFTPAHDLDSNAVVVPVAFGEITATVTDPDGNVVESETDPPASKGSSAKNPNATTNCSFSASATDPDGFTFSLSGTATVMITPSR